MNEFIKSIKKIWNGDKGEENPFTNAPDSLVLDFGDFGLIVNPTTLDGKYLRMECFLINKDGEIHNITD